MTTSIRLSTRRGVIAFTLLMLGAGVVGCDKQPAASSNTAAAPADAAAPTPGHAPTANRETLLAKLASADAFDGKTDKVVSKCAGCALGMDGSEKYTVQFEGYSLHLCNDACRKQFASDTVNAVLAMRVPGAKP
ncbi:hypothetical protein RAS2_06190 [Phycisphaerae bacterium RAS2]|nr:hypothetical protein RAS2_06190 [Phycisphaerae bacterium RAS2]